MLAHIKLLSSLYATEPALSIATIQTCALSASFLHQIFFLLFRLLPKDQQIFELLHGQVPTSSRRIANSTSLRHMAVQELLDSVFYTILSPADGTGTLTKVTGSIAEGILVPDFTVCGASGPLEERGPG